MFKWLFRSPSHWYTAQVYSPFPLGDTPIPMPIGDPDVRY